MVSAGDSGTSSCSVQISIYSCGAMRNLHVVVLIAASVLLSSVRARTRNQNTCCKSSRCQGCACRSNKYSLAIEEYLEESYRKKLETLEEVLDKSSQKPKTIDDSIKDKYEAAITASDNGDDNSTRPDNGTDGLKEPLGIDFSNQFAGYIPLDCLICKISHC
ncbi:uncharacterized protein LOC143781316 [Ranitomeya variabilis]|uniref:uncharacterized protein LOC143781316 n=1 Tax=Ranitomeya variabilis TaxID=490064 RepID=UPI004056F439